jgi:hypothetical protein
MQDEPKVNQRQIDSGDLSALSASRRRDTSLCVEKSYSGRIVSRSFFGGDG